MLESFAAKTEELFVVRCKVTTQETLRVQFGDEIRDFFSVFPLRSLTEEIKATKGCLKFHS